jgi:hypothetical protein
MRLLFAILALLASMFVTACGGKKPPIVQPTVVREVVTQEVKIPVPVKAQPPAELLTPILAPLPVFVPPTHPEASSALTAEGERLLRALLEDVLSRLAA